MITGLHSIPSPSTIKIKTNVYEEEIFKEAISTSNMCYILRFHTLLCSKTLKVEAPAAVLLSKFYWHLVEKISNHMFEGWQVCLQFRDHSGLDNSSKNSSRAVAHTNTAPKSRIFKDIANIFFQAWRTSAKFQTLHN